MMVGCLMCRFASYLGSSGTDKNVSIKIKGEYFILFQRTCETNHSKWSKFLHFWIRLCEYKICNYVCLYNFNIL